MTVRRKMLVVGLIMVSVIAVVMACSYAMLRSGILRHEEDQVRENVSRARAALNNELTALGRFTDDYAGWDDTYAFVENRNEGYIESNLVDDTFEKDKLSLCVILDTGGEIAFAKAFDISSGEETGLPEGLAEHLRAGGKLIDHEEISSEVRGILALAGGAYMVASRPVLTSHYEGPIRGTLIFGRALDEQAVRTLGEVTHLSIELRGVSKEGETGDFTEADFGGEGDIPIRVLSNTRIAGGALLEDVYGKPALVMSVAQGRAFHGQSMRSLRGFLGATLVVMMAVGLAAAVLMERWVLRRLDRLAAFVTGVREDNLSQRVSMRGEDELAMLAASVDRMLDALERDSKIRDAVESALRESENRYKALFNGILTAFVLGEVILDAEEKPCDYRFLDVNPAFERVTGLKRYQVIGRCAREFLDYVDDWLDVLGRVAMTEEPANFTRYAATLGRHFEGSAYCPERGKFAVTFADVTERFKAEEEIQSLKSQLDFILGATKTGIDIIDAEFTVRYMDPEWKKVYGEYAGRKCYEYFMGGKEPCPGCGIVEALRTKKVSVTEQVLAKENNRPIQVTTLPFQNKDGEWLVAEVNVDISERKRLEAQLIQAQKMEAIGQLAGGIAHDFNNLLTGILGYANMLRLDSAGGTGVHEAAATIEKAAERAAELTKQLLGFARRGKFLRAAVDVNSLAQEVVRLLGRTIDKSIAVTQWLAAQPPWVVGDPDQIEQAILNLAVNARDAMPEGGELKIETEIMEVDEGYVKTASEASFGRYVWISVSDTGVGIPEELREKVFEPFFTTKEKGQGSGMGLAMVYGIVKNHGGFLRLYSEVGRGTRVDIHLPAAEGHAPARGREQKEAQRGTGGVLLVDDEPLVREAGGQMLRSLGYEVTEAADAAQAVEYYRGNHGGIDVVIIDMVMPRGGGRECFLALKAINSGVRAVLSTGYGIDGKAQEAMDEGMCGFIQKPYTLADLSAAVAAARKWKGE